MKNLKTNFYRLFSVCMILLLSNFYSNSAMGQCNPAVSDPNFNPNDTGFGFGQGTLYGVEKFVIMADNKIVVINRADTYNNQPVASLFRLNEDGTIDNSFTAFTSTPFAGASFSDIEALPNQKLLVSGNIVDGASQQKNIIRLNADGSVDNTFSATGLEPSNVRNIILQDDGKIIVTGTLKVGGADKDIARLNADGSLDTSFITGDIDITFQTTRNGIIRETVIQNDGKIVILGDFDAYNGVTKNNLLRLNTDGTLDNSFSSPVSYRAINGIESIAIQPSSGKIILAGSFDNYEGTAVGKIVRLNVDGSVDMGFIQGTGFNDGIFQIFPQDNGRILVLTNANSYNGASIPSRIARLKADGTLDTSFIPPNVAIQGVGQFVELSNGKILTNHTISHTGIDRLNADGSYDVTFNPNTGFNNTVLSIAGLGNGQFFATGYLTEKYNGLNTGSIVKINADGSVDTSFKFNQTSLGSGNRLSGINYFTSLTAQPDGKLLVSSFSVLPKSTSEIRKFFRVNADGTIDNSFVVEGTLAISRTGGLGGKSVVQSDGKIIVTGSLGALPATVYKTMRLNRDGSLDNSFVEITTDSIVHDIVIQSDGKVLLGGSFNNVNGSPTKKLVRFLPNGTIDNTFSTDLDLNLVSSIDTLNNEIYVSGNYNNGSSLVGTVRKVSSTGVMNTTLNPEVTIGTGLPYPKMRVDKNGGIILAGDFTKVNGTNQKNFAKLDADGNLFTGFDIGTSVDNAVYDLLLQPDNSIILAGAFLSYNGIGRNRVVRITNQPALVTNLTPPSQQTGICRDITTTLVTKGLGEISWYESPTSTTPIHIGNTYTTPVITADSTYFYAEDFVADCGKSERLAILVTVEDTVRINTRNITVYLNETGTVEVNATQIDSLSKLACGDTIASYTFKDTGLETRSYSCADTVTNEVWLQVTDKNGNSHAAQAFIQVKDTIPPVVQTQPFAVSLATNTASVTISVSDLISSLSDNCTNNSDLEVVFDDTGTTTKNFSCGNFSNTNIRVTDKSGNITLAPIQLTNIGFDFDVNLTTTVLRPARFAYVRLNVLNRLPNSNSSCVPFIGQVEITMDDLVKYDYEPSGNPYFINKTPSSINGNTLVWDFYNLGDGNPNAVANFRIAVDSSVNIGDQICFTVKVTPTVGDINLANNTKTYCLPVRNSYDPNDKQVYPQGICDDKFTKRSDSPLTYTIRFQNTGNAPAIDVNIVDSLSSLLDIRSLKVVGYSHPMVVDTLQNNTVRFRFNDIMLPDSTSSPEASQGYVIFEIDEIAAHTDTSRIENKSYIYFDLNAPIITNSVKNTIVDILPNCNPTTPNPPIADCTLPTNLRTEILSSTRVKLLWTTPTNTNAVTYEVLRNGQRLNTVPSSNLSYIDSTLSANTQYNYSIKAICGNSNATSNSVQIRTLPSTPVLLSIVSACKGEKGRVNVQSAGAVYRVYASQTSTTPLFVTSNASIETTVLNDTTTFYISVIIGGVESEKLKAVVPIKEVFDAVIEQGALLESCSTAFTLSAKEVENATYIWFRDNLQVGTARTFTTNFPARYKVRVIKNGCFDDSEFTTTRFVTAPSAKIQQGTSVSFCGSGILNAQDTSSNVVYTWILNGEVIKTGTSVSVSESGTYTLKASQPSCTDSTSIVVTITNAPANVSLTTSKTAICPSEEAILSVTTGTGFTYNWFRNGTAISNDLATFTTSEIGKYKVEITTTEGCKTESNEVEITETQAPNATITINKENSFDKTITVSSSDSIVSVVWSKDENEVSSFANQRTIEPTESGSYKSKVTYLSGCTFETEEKIFDFEVVSGIEEESAKIFTIYPNPNNGSFKVEFAQATNQKTTLTLVDALGRIIHSQELSMNERTTNMTLPKISSGVYVVQIVSEGKVYTKQLIIQ